MSFEEHDFEPVRGLPASLPDGETMLWQGAPRWDVFARRVMKIRWVAFYFMFLVAWGSAERLATGKTVAVVSRAMAPLSVLAVVAVGVLLAFAVLVARTTVYTITNRRVVLRFGIAMPMTIQIPFRLIEAAGVTVGADGAGDIALALQPGQKIAYVLLWPHARPWRFTRPEAALRSLAGASDVAQILSTALAGSAPQSAKAVRIKVSKSAGTGSHVPAAA